MTRIFLVLAAVVLGLAACAPVPSTTTPRLGPDGQPLPTVYRIGPGDKSRIEFRMLDAVNALRTDAGLSEVSFDSRLNAAATTHSRDMSVQQRPWLFGSDGSSPVDRLQRVGYQGQLVGEVISESYETELQTLAAWMADAPSREILLAPEARDMGFAWFQENGGKLWWSLVMGAPGSAPSNDLVAGL
ncbi:CAP domain-containing protein [Roseivivax isoporae]|uniref:SCP domain-containing protein n=1 Tax=Roseivivax isoporae LMG 25204 TaxID=1449351 RepID=X7F415_9RHOB|nr:CAP domain-containing protein [Roseivivax isoporae]ETX27647.1 hypothetical protein RISW2_11930 [Roseivivax isoporae LMG 25204]